MTSPAAECAVCGSSMHRLYRLAVPGNSWLHRCPACGFCSTSPLPAAIEGYDDAYTASAEAERKNRRLAPDYFRKIRPFLPDQQFRFLEVGGAHGWLAQIVRDQTRATVTLLEPGRTAVAAAQSRGLDARLGYLENFRSNEPFDVICAAHVVEHVVDVPAFLALLSPLIRPGGTLLLLTPNSDAWKLAVFGRHWGWAVPEQHTTFLNAESARRLLPRCGFEPISLPAQRPAFPHYPIFLARWLAEWRRRLPQGLWRVSGLFTRPVALAEYLFLSCADAILGMRRADELLIVARKR